MRLLNIYTFGKRRYCRYLFKTARASQISDEISMAISGPSVVCHLLPHILLEMENMRNASEGVDGSTVFSGIHRYFL